MRILNKYDSDQNYGNMNDRFKNVKKHILKKTNNGTCGLPVHFLDILFSNVT